MADVNFVDGFQLTPSILDILIFKQKHGDLKNIQVLMVQLDTLIF